MPYIKKPAFETFRANLITHGKPLLERDIVPIQTEIVQALDQVKDLLVQKSRRLSNKEAIIEITATWVGMDASPRLAISTLKRAWSGEVFGGHEELFTIGEHEESVLLVFAARYPESRYLTGRLLVTF